MTSTQVGFSTTELVRFLLARLDDEEQSLRKLVRRARYTGRIDEGLSVSRQRSEIIAARQIIGHVQQLIVLRDLPSERVVRDVATQVLQSLAQPYTTHPQYRSAWEPARP
jgi:hypothetical protein